MIARRMEIIKFKEYLFISVSDDLFSAIARPILPIDVFDASAHFSVNENLECPK